MNSNGKLIWEPCCGPLWSNITIVPQMRKPQYIATILNVRIRIIIGLPGKRHRYA